MDVLLLSRVQFAANISFHILFPTITIALGWLLLYFRLRYARSGEAAWMDAYRFWVKIFALSFAMGVVSGITMSFQFGTNWPGFMEMVGNIAGPLLAYEILTAFFLEAVFLGIMLFGASRVPGWLHILSTFLVALGTTMSAFWIIVLNSWMHTPAGFEMRDGVAHATDWLAIILNPSMPYRLTHMFLASGLTTAFLIAGLSAFRMLRGDGSDGVRVAMRTSVGFAAILIPLQILMGDLHGLNTLEYQPAKVAAMEGNWETRGNVPLLLFALPDENLRENRAEIGIPSLASDALGAAQDELLGASSALRGGRPRRDLSRSRRPSAGSRSRSGSSRIPLSAGQGACCASRTGSTRRPARCPWSSRWRTPMPMPRRPSACPSCPTCMWSCASPRRRGRPASVCP